MSPILDDGAGWKGTDTSREAAESIAPDTGRLRILILNTLEKHGALTADEIADRMGESVLSIRPRVSELRNMGRIADTGYRRANKSGRKAAVWDIRQ